jgi:hypothetical protein
MDMSKWIEPKSDQLNADDLLGGPRIITVTGVRGTDAADQPVAISYEGDGGKPYKPCKSMRRVMVHCWGKDAASYAGKSMELYCDPDVQFGGMKVGGIRIRAMSHIDAKKQFALTATRGKKAAYTVQPLKAPEKEDAAAKWADAYIAKLDTLDAEALDMFMREKAHKLLELQTARPDLHARITAELERRRPFPAQADSSGFEDDLVPPQQTGSDYDGA